MKSLYHRFAATRVGGALVGVVKRYGERQTGDKAAGLTYFAVLSVFPGLIVIAGLLGVLGSEGTVEGLLRIIKDLAPGSAADTFEGPARQLINGGGAGTALVIGIAVALYSSSGYIGAFNRAANAMYGVEETRPFWRTLPRQVLLTLFLLGSLAAVLFAVVLTGPLAEAIGNEIDVGDQALHIFSIIKWPLMFVVVSILFAVLLHRGPNLPDEPFKAMLPGAFLATTLWLLASAGFAEYVANFGKYASTYGSLAGVIVFLLWLWLSNLVLLLGTSFNVELRRDATEPSDPAEESASPAQAETASSEGAETA